MSFSKDSVTVPCGRRGGVEAGRGATVGVTVIAFEWGAGAVTVRVFVGGAGAGQEGGDWLAAVPSVLLAQLANSSDPRTNLTAGLAILAMILLSLDPPMIMAA